MPTIVQGFKRAKVFDGTQDGSPFVVDRPAVPPGPERTAIIGYLRQGKPILRAAGLAEDLLDTSRGEKVPMVYLTDGEWIWDAAIRYYLEQHDLPPEPEFVEYMRAKQFRYTAPTGEQVKAASKALRAR